MRIIGVDEAGRGALIGNVVAAAVILPDSYDAGQIADSKSLSEQKREQYAAYIRSIALSYAIAAADSNEIDTLNIHHATLLAMRRAIEAVQSDVNGDYDAVWVDGKFTPTLADSGCVITAFVKGDALHDCISAASILAKTYRDAELNALDAHYPQYGFAKHKGYPTKAHRQAIEQYGLLPEHRRSYKTVQAFLATVDSS